MSPTTCSKTMGCGAPAPQEQRPGRGDSGATKKILVMVTTDRIGHGDDTLGAALMENFLRTLPEMGPDLWRMVLVNNGVKLAVAGASALPALEALAVAGVSILVCTTCLNHFGLAAARAVGEATNMVDIVTSLALADQVINI